MKIFGSKKKKDSLFHKEKKLKINEKVKENNPLETGVSFTKRLVALIVINGILWVWCSYILAFLGMITIAESLSSQVVTVVLGTGLGYFIKSLIENLSK